MSMLNKAQILDVEDLTTETVSVPEWGGDVLVQSMTGAERDSFETSLLEGKGADKEMNTNNLRAKLVGKCLVDGKGKRLFTDKDIEALGEKSAEALDRIYDVAQKLNGIGVKEVEDLTKN